MPKYKKKKHNRILNAPKKRAKQPVRVKDISDDIEMTRYDSKKVKRDSAAPMKVVKGNKGVRTKKIKTYAVALAVVFVVVMLFQLILPAGLFQTVSNITAVVGTGSYPIAVSGSQTLSVVPMGNYYLHLTDTHFSAYSSAGKILFSEAHGYENPVLSASKGKSLLYNQGGKQFSVYTLNGIQQDGETKNEIICGAISDSGNFAIASYSESYASQVTVYNKRYKQIYEWYSAEDTINNVAVASSGRKIAVSTFNSSSGVFNSKINVINFKSATPEHTLTYENKIIYGLKSCNKSNFSVIKSNGVDTVKWSNYKLEDYTDDYTISYYRNNSSVNIAVFSRERDKTDNKIVVFSKRGRVKKTVNYNGAINDIQVRGSNIYCINDSSVNVLDFDGNVKFSAEYGFGGKGISVISANVVAVITNNEILRIKLGERK